MDDPNRAIHAKNVGGKALAIIISTTVAFVLVWGMTLDGIGCFTGDLIS